MKKLGYLLILAFLAMSLYTNAQEVEREMVVLEIGTGTWCPYCPGAAKGADDLVEKGHDVAVIEYHSGDAFQNQYSLSRIGYYNISSYPTAVFDGVLKYVGGHQSQSLYYTYLPKYQQRKAIDSPFTIDVEGELYSYTDYSTTVTVEKVASYSGSNPKLQYALTESHIKYAWQGMDTLNFVERLMVPDQYGTTLDFSGGDTQEITMEFSIDESWVRENMEIVVFVQTNSSKEIHQGTKLDLTEFPPAYDYNASVKSIRNIPVENCTETISPVVTISNISETELTQLQLNYKVNDGEVHTYQWTGSVGFLDTTEVELPSIPFALENENTITVYSTDPNGENDEYPDNDTITDSFTGAQETPTTMKLYLMLDSKPEETSWNILDSGNQVLYEGGDYTDPGQIISETFEFEQVGCYTFNIYDSGGDGLKQGFFVFYYGDDNIILEGTNFGDQSSIQFGAGGFVETDEVVYSGELKIYPNPFRYNAFIDLNLDQPENISIEIYNLVGKKVFQTSRSLGQGNHQLKISPEDVDSGIYFVKIKIGDKTYTKKISIIR